MRVGFREMRDRFAHIDGVVEDLRFSRSEPSFVAIRFYPWWEHPLFVAARAAGRPWKIDAPPEEATRVMTVHAIDPVHLTADLHTSAVEIEFHDSGPRLWPFETHGHMFVNEPIPADVLPELARRTAIAEHALASLADFGSTRVPSALETPPAVHATLHTILDERGVSHLATYGGTPSNLVVFEFDGNLLAAHDFEVDVPDWEHRDAWFA
jgi:hypothetical protein